MEKVTQFLEKHVQWIVLGLAVLFLGYMAYSNLLQSPVKVTINGQEMLPGEVNEQIVNGPVNRISADLKKEAPVITVPDFVAVFRQNMGMVGPQYASAAKPLPAPVFPGAGAVKDTEAGEEGPGVLVKALPTLPKPSALKNSSGLTVAMEPKPDAAQPGGAAAPAPAAVADNANGADVKQVIKTMDVDWFTLMGTIQPAELQKAWYAAYGDPQSLAQTAPEVVQQLFRTQFLRVEMERDEQLPSGEWANKPVIVSGLKLYKYEPLPPADGTAEARLKYLDWASKNEEQLARPAFYEWGQKGKQWYAPGQEPPKDNTVPSAVPYAPPPGPYQNPYFRPAPGMPVPRRQGSMGPRPKMSPDGHTMLAGLAGRRSAAVLPVSGGPPGGYRGGGGYPPYGGYRSPYGGGYPYGPGGYGGGGYRPIQPGYQQGYQPSFAGGGQGIDITTLQQPIQFWAHDESGVPGKTYRYRIRYCLFNPVHGAPQLVDPKNPKLAETLYVTSPWSDWTAPVKVAERVKFWLARNPSPREATFDVYTWQDGSWKNKKETVQPGDPVSTTPWVLVDLRQASRGSVTAMLVNTTTGVMERHDYRRDAEDPDRVNMQDETTTAAGAAMAR